MALQQKEFQLGDLKGMIYDFPEKGDTLPMHTHTEQDVHITIVAKGKFKVKGTEWTKNVTAGNILDWQPNQPHEFTATTKGARIVNIIKNIPDSVPVANTSNT